MASIHGNVGGNLCFNHFRTPCLGSFPAGILQVRLGLSNSRRSVTPYTSIKCEKKEYEYGEFEYVERPPYHVYEDSTSGELEPASGARASIPGQEYWPEGTANQVRAARAPEPTGESSGSPSYGQNPGSRRKSYKSSAAASSSEVYVESDDPNPPESSVDSGEEDSQDYSSDFVVYQSEPEEEETGYDLDKKLGRPHPFLDPKARKPMGEPLSSEELWWHWRKPEFWSRWQRRKPDVETVFLKAMAETGQIKLYGEHPTLTETSLYGARRNVFKEERLQAEQEKLARIGPLAYYSEWVKAWKRDTSREAVQKHFEETGEDENTQLIEMFSHQTDREYRIMMGTDVRIRRDPLAMRMREDQIKQIWGGDPVYPTINYIKDPNEVIDFRGADFHEPTPDMADFLKEQGIMITREEIDQILGKEKKEEVQIKDVDDAMSKAVDIGENDDEEEECDIEAMDKVGEEEEEGEGEEEKEGEGEGEEEEVDEKIDRNWSVLKTSPQLRKSKPKPKKKEPMSLQEAVDDSENLTDFLLDFEEPEE